ncbi:MAG: glycosyltransferase family 2 protein [Candidatus Omnitrophota bacterium]|jgi:hypothetical protein
MPEISVVVVTCNSGKYITACLDSLVSQTYKDFETIIVDNGSGDSTVRLIKEDFPFFNLIENSENAGACRARNQGIEKSKGSWILTLDCDVILAPDFLAGLTDHARHAVRDIGAFQPKIYHSGSRIIFSFGIDLSPWIRFHDRGRGRSDTGQFNDVTDIFGACSAAAFYRKDALETIKEENGFFDERFFFLVEDVDVALRMGKKGWKTVFIPEVVCYHAGNSSGMNMQKRRFLCWRNRKLLIAKNRIRKPPFVLLYDIPRFIWLACTNHFFREYYFDGAREPRAR